MPSLPLSTLFPTATSMEGFLMQRVMCLPPQDPSLDPLHMRIKPELLQGPQGLAPVHLPIISLATTEAVLSVWNVPPFALDLLNPHPPQRCGSRYPTAGSIFVAQSRARLQVPEGPKYMKKKTDWEAPNLILQTEL